MKGVAHMSKPDAFPLITIVLGIILSTYNTFLSHDPTWFRTFATLAGAYLIILGIMRLMKKD